MTIADQITALVLTHNEEDNIERTLAALHWVPHILVIDSGSSDRTLAIVDRFSQCEVVARSFDSFAGQCNFGLSRIASPWVLSLDADYVVSESLVREIQALTPEEDASGFRASFIYRVYGRDLRSTLYPPRTVLYRRDKARYRDVGHGHRVAIAGTVASLNAPIYHDDRKPLSRWFDSQQRYAKIETDYLLAVRPIELSRTERVRRMGWLAPVLIFFYTLIVKCCILDGWAGWLYARQRTVAETLIGLEIVERRLRSRLKYST